MSCLWGVLGWFWIFVKNFFEGHTSLRPEEPLHPPHPFVTSRDISTALLTCYVSTCCNIDTLAFVSLRVSKFRFLGAFLAGRFCVYITQMNFHFYRFSALFALSYLVLFYRFSILFLSFSRFVLLPLIRAICPIVFCAYCQPGRGGVTFDSLVNVPRYHVATLPRYRVATLIVVAV